jgi:hypothetical protein
MVIHTLGIDRGVLSGVRINHVILLEMAVQVPQSAQVDRSQCLDSKAEPGVIKCSICCPGAQASVIDHVCEPREGYDYSNWKLLGDKSYNIDPDTKDRRDGRTAFLKMFMADKSSPQSPCHCSIRAPFLKCAARCSAREAQVERS